MVAPVPSDDFDPDKIIALRASLWNGKYRVLAVTSWNHPDPARAGKAPLGPNWGNGARQEPPEVIRIGSAVAHAQNTGILCDGLRVVDCDVDDAAIVQQIRKRAQETLGDTVVRVRDNSPRIALIYRAAEGSPRKRVISGAAGKIEILGHGQQIVSHGKHPSGAELRWFPVGPEQMPLEHLPAVTEEQIGAFLDACAPLLGPETKPNGRGNGVDHDGHEPVSLAADFEAIANGEGSHDATVRLVGRLMAQGIPLADILHIANNAYLRRPVAERDAAWHTARRDLKRLIIWAYDRERASRIQPAAPPPPEQPQPPPDQGPVDPPDDAKVDQINTDLDLDDTTVPAFSEEHLALSFAEGHPDLRYVDDWGWWLKWSGTVWQRDDTRRTHSLVRKLTRHIAETCKKQRTAAALASRRTIASVEYLARCDRRLAATVEQWDRDATLLNTPHGVVDLTTGQLRPHSAADYITKITAVAPAGDCPRFLAFLDVITGHDTELQAYLQRVAGYFLTGSVREHAMFFAYGAGANGKSTFTGALSGLLGSYSAVSQMETFTYSANDRHPCDLAMLRGARLVTAQETEEGRRLAEAKVKAMTGGDPITARFMRQDFFTYTPAFKLLIAGNHRPALRSVGEAIKRRLHLVPFNITIPPEEQDKRLAHKLRREWPGILAWAIQGCLEWQRIGLAPPEAVTAASQEYMEAEDLLGAWMAEHCDKGRATYTDTLYSSFRFYAEQGGEFVMSKRRFVETLAARGFRQERDKRRSSPNRDRQFIKGLGLRDYSGDVS